MCPLLYTKSNIAPKTWIEGNAVLAFIIIFFYEINQHQDVLKAFKKAQETDDETSMMTIFKEK